MMASTARHMSFRIDAEQLPDLPRLERVLFCLPDWEINAALQEYRGRGPNGHPVAISSKK